MVNFLAAVGLVFVILAFWKGRSQAARERQELEEYKRIKDELTETKKEVDSLLEQLEAVSEKVVEEITAAVDEARRTGQVTALPGVRAQGSKTPGNKNILSEHCTTEDDDGNDTYESNSEVTVEISGKQTEMKTYHCEKPQARPSTDTKPGITGKTIKFPLKTEGLTETPAAVNHCQSGKEVPPKHQMVYAMAKLGYSEADIAKQLSVGRGEVRLILQLKRKGEEANG